MRSQVSLEAASRGREQQQQQAAASRTGARFLAALLMIITVAIGQPPPVGGVDCFKCSSRNGSNPACEDPFHNLNTTRVVQPVLPDPPPHVIYHTPCYAGKKGREGLFPASACIKLTGTFDHTGETLVVRHCALDSGTLTQDTELARMSHCGRFQFEGDLLKGCVMACPNDACNAATNLEPDRRIYLLLALMMAVRMARHLYSSLIRDESPGGGSRGRQASLPGGQRRSGAEDGQMIEEEAAGEQMGLTSGLVENCCW